MTTENLDYKASMRSIIQRIATGPTLSKDIDLEEARIGMTAILQQKVDPVQAAIFFIALRMKRETDDENKGVLEAILQATRRAQADVEDLVDIADPYDGYNRSLPASPFLPPLLAACGVPAISQGLESVGPKYGVTHRLVLQAAGADVDLTPEQASARLADPSQGWAYVDQKHFCPQLHDLLDLREKIIKRQVITTVEVMAKPIAARGKTHLITGYVHKPYPPIYATLARHAGYDSALLVRGVEGGVIPSLRQTGKYYFYQDLGEEIEVGMEPKDLGIEQSLRAPALPEDLPKASRPGDEIAIAVDIGATAAAAAKAGLSALEGKPGATYDALVYSGALILHHLGRESSLAKAAQRVRGVLDSGVARERFPE
jgi:anthranilate phosphoribosyltransferase